MCRDVPRLPLLLTAALSRSGRKIKIKNVVSFLTVHHFQVKPESDNMEL